MEGIIDRAFCEASGWVIADYNTDVSPTAEVRAVRSARYRKIVSLYAHCWERITGEPANKRVLPYTGGGHEEAW